MSDLNTGQVARDAAEVYEQFYLPALFDAWPPHLLRLASIHRGERLLDVACGTGVVARAAARAVGSPSLVTGVDINQGMLAVARRQGPGIDFRHAPAEALPFEDASFDAVTCQFALMFFEDRAAALREMCRVLRPAHRMIVAVWDRLDTTPGYLQMVNLIEETFGAAVAAGLRSPFVLGEEATLRGVFNDAGIPISSFETVPGRATFPSIDAWVHTDVRGWTMSEDIDEEGLNRLLELARVRLARFAGEGGRVEFAAPAHLVTVLK